MNTLLPFVTGTDSAPKGTPRPAGTAGAARSAAGAERPFVEILEKGRAQRSDDAADTRPRDDVGERNRPADRVTARDGEGKAATSAPADPPQGLAGGTPLSIAPAPAGPVGLLFGGASPGQGIQSANLTRQIMTQIQNFAAEYGDNPGPSTLTLKLNPDHLGFLQVDFTPHGTRLQVAMTTASPEAEAVLKEDLNRLTDALMNRVGRFQQVEVRVELKSANAEDSADQNERDQGRSHERHGENAKQERQSPQGLDDESDAMDSTMPRQEG